MIAKKWVCLRFAGARDKKSGAYTMVQQIWILTIHALNMNIECTEATDYLLPVKLACNLEWCWAFQILNLILFLYPNIKVGFFLGGGRGRKYSFSGQTCLSITLFFSDKIIDGTIFRLSEKLTYLNSSSIARQRSITFKFSSNYPVSKARAEIAHIVWEK